LNGIFGRSRADGAVAPVAVSVKGLEWRANPLMNWVAPSIVGQYFVFKDAGDSTWAMAVPDAVAAGEFKTADLAKAAAQADFNARILSSIIPATKGGEQPSPPHHQGMEYQAWCWCRASRRLEMILAFHAAINRWMAEDAEEDDFASDKRVWQAMLSAALSQRGTE
jgi:hypothetical protein